MRPPQLWRYTGLLQAAARHVDRFLVGSRFSREKHRELGLEAPIVHLPFFVPEGREPTDTELPVEIGPEPYFLFVGRLMKIKGLQTLIPVFRDYGKARLLIAGSGRHERPLRRLARDNRGVRFLDHVPYGQLQVLYRNAVAVIVPSIAYEVAPLVIPEALGHGTPVIVRNLGGLPEQVEDSGGGFVYDTEQELVAAMDRLLEDPSYRRDLGQRGYQAYQRGWTADVHIRRYLALIRDIGGTSLSQARPTSATRS
jgi:glycosyltransferase involved in cell wall biosynthesis